MIRNDDLIADLEKMSRQLRRDVVESIGIGHAGHLGGSCSSAEMMSVLYFYKMRYDPSDPKMEERDRFLLSKGHVAILQYAALAEAGFFDREELKRTKALGSMLQGHPDILKTPGIEAGTGSLGQGVSIGLGMALGLKMNHNKAHVYVLAGDGEICEGQIWEAAMAAAAYKANNLTVLLDNNGMQATGFIKDRMDSGDLAAKWKAFGWKVLEIDGHKIPQIIEALDEAERSESAPVIIIAHTVKGKGVSFAENVASYHNGTLTEETYAQALRELS